MNDTDQVNHPSHYGGSNHPHEAIKVIEGHNLGFNNGNAVKYILRAGKKPGVPAEQDIKKAMWYLNRELENLTKQPYEATDFVNDRNSKRS